MNQPTRTELLRWPGGVHLNQCDYDVRSVVLALLERAEAAERAQRSLATATLAMAEDGQAVDRVASKTWRHVLAFAHRMEAKLELNRDKGDREGWLKDHPAALVERLREELVELEEALGSLAFVAPTGAERSTPEEIANEAADVANFAMMIADVVDHRAGGR